MFVTMNKDSFKFTANFVRMSFKSIEPVYDIDSSLDKSDRLVGGLVESQKKIVRLIIENH